MNTAKTSVVSTITGINEGQILYRRFYTHLWIVSFISAYLIGCDQKSTTHPKTKTGVVYCGAIQPKTLNPQLADGGLHADVLSSQLFERLIQLNPTTYEPMPMLAQSWDISPDGKTYTFTLRDKVPFHTSAQFFPTRFLNAHDVVFSFQRFIQRDHPYHQTNGGQYPFFDSLQFSNQIKSIRAIDDRHVQFKLNKPDASFLSTLSTPYAVIHSQEYAEQLIEQDKRETLDFHPIGTGPFVFDKEVPHHFIRLRPHQNYWQGKPQITQLIFDTSHRGSSNLTKLFTHECDVVSSPLASQVSVIADHPDFSLIANTGLNLAFLILNTQHEALSKTEIRQAISLGINREAIIKTVYHGAGTSAQSMLPPLFWSHSVTEQHLYNPTLARALMANAGYRNGFSVDLIVPETPRPYNPSPRKTAEMIQTQLAQINIRVNIIFENTINRHLLKDRQDELEMVLTGWIADSGDPETFLRPHLACNQNQTGWNFSNWCHAEFNALLDAGIAVNDPIKRKEIYVKAQSILLDQMPVIPLAYGIQYQASVNDLHGLNFSPFGDVSFYRVSRNP